MLTVVVSLVLDAISNSPSNVVKLSNSWKGPCAIVHSLKQSMILS